MIFLKSKGRNGVAINQQSNRASGMNSIFIQKYAKILLMQLGAEETVQINVHTGYNTFLS